MDYEEKKMLEQIMESLEEIKGELKKINSVHPTSKTLPSDPQGKKIAETLSELGMRHNLKGYIYWEFAISWALEQDIKDICITKGLNQNIADKFQTTISSADRDLRHAVRSAFNKNTELFGKLFPHYEKAPSISEFLYRMIHYMQKGY